MPFLAAGLLFLPATFFAQNTLTVQNYVSAVGQPFYGVSGNGTNIFAIGSGNTRVYDLGLNQISSAANSQNVIDGGAGRNPETQTLELQSDGNLYNVRNSDQFHLGSYDLSPYSPTAVGQTINIGGVNYVPYISSDLHVRILNLDNSASTDTGLVLDGDFTLPTGLGNYLALGGSSFADLHFVVTANPGGDGLVGDFDSSGLARSYVTDLPLVLFQDVFVDVPNGLLYIAGDAAPLGRIGIVNTTRDPAVEDAFYLAGVPAVTLGPGSGENLAVTLTDARPGVTNGLLEAATVEGPWTTSTVVVATGIWHSVEVSATNEVRFFRSRTF